MDPYAAPEVIYFLWGVSLIFYNSSLYLRWLRIIFIKVGGVLNRLSSAQFTLTHFALLNAFLVSIVVKKTVNLEKLFFRRTSTTLHIRHSTASMVDLLRAVAEERQQFCFCARYTAKSSCLCSFPVRLKSPGPWNMVSLTMLLFHAEVTALRVL